MKIMMVVGSALLMAAPLWAEESKGTGAWTVGTNMGLSVLTGSGSSLVSVAWPGSSNLFFGGVQPGFRLGYVAGDDRFDAYLDTGFGLWSAEGSTLYSTTNTLNVQKNFSSSPNATPYVTGGIGFDLIGGEGASQTRAVLGAGLGVRRPISDGHGSVRTEFRYDRLTGADGGPGLNSFQVKFGVDLWLR